MCAAVVEIIFVGAVAPVKYLAPYLVLQVCDKYWRQTALFKDW